MIDVAGEVVGGKCWDIVNRRPSRCGSQGLGNGIKAVHWWH